MPQFILNYDSHEAQFILIYHLSNEARFILIYYSHEDKFFVIVRNIIIHFIFILFSRCMRHRPSTCIISLSTLFNLVLYTKLGKIHQHRYQYWFGYHHDYFFSPIQEEFCQQIQSCEGLKDCSSPCASQRGMEPARHHTDQMLMLIKIMTMTE